MKRKIFTSFFLSALLSVGAIQAQLLLEENFDYDANRPLVLDAVASSDNYDGVTGWSTQSNTLSGTNCFNITDAPLTYNGYYSSGIGNAMKYTGDAGQGVFKLFPKNIRNDSTVYISFLVNFPNVAVSGGDYFLGIKMEPSATSTNWGGRVFVAVDPTYTGEEVTVGINKMSGGTTTWVNAATGPFFPANTTLLFVVKYKVGVLNGNSATEEAGKFDDEMSLFVNPALTSTEPTTPTLFHASPTQNDLYRYTSSGLIFGGARGIYLRSSATGNAPAYTIDGIRVGEKWTDVVLAPNGLKDATADNFSYRMENKNIVITASEFNYNRYELTALSGQRLLSGSLLNSNGRIDASTLSSGVYILTLQGNQRASAKILIQ
ncbi:MAG: T9SS type A sorting domain-containing protein [Paludibacter sp.]|nr:T9SS type A sorting domain-containing protein [Paludibacter sp.]